MLNFNTEFLFGPNLVELLEIGSDEIDYNVDIDMGAAAGEVRVGKSQFLRYPDSNSFFVFFLFLRQHRSLRSFEELWI